jgi:tripartite-type tricarboxylate transporter receptor subunit TctC
MLRHYGKADVQHVPYQGAPAAQIDVLAGRAQLQFTAGSAVPLIREGKLKALAVTGEKRLAALPDVPTMKEAGYPELTVITWYGIHGPAGIPAAVVEKINGETNKALKNAEVAKVIVDAGFDPSPMTVKEFQAFMADQETTIMKIWKETGAKME